MAFPANRPSVLANRKIEVGSLVGLKDMFDIQSGISPIIVWKLRFPFLPALSQFPFRNHQVEHSVIRVQPDQSPVAASDKGPPASDSGDTCRTTVPKPDPDILASDTRNMSLTPSLACRLEIGMLPTSGIPGYPLGPHPLSTGTVS